ncbi:lytic transglycosylase domain-containing protein [Rhodococcoides yunnanense]|uniref:lytic transglycosylase domain-containing protein n=1 Tax=Rhodococcoides yunnanense TaxID=278209 RepID=UPI000A7B29C7|nr:lytic murein transglycosylase [Rhodococcus yunnanensis]
MSTIVFASVAGAAASASLAADPAPVPVVSPAPLPDSTTLLDSLPNSKTVAGLAAPTPRPAQTLSAYTPALPEIEEQAPTEEEPVRSVAVSTPVVGSFGIPDSVLAAYRSAESAMASESPSCHLPWNLLAGIGRIESGHARGGQVDDDGTTISPILGPILDGRRAGNTVILDTDHGDLDGDSAHDRAVGPMQFIPSTWSRYASDGNDDGIENPDNIYDATLAAGRYLCSGGEDLAEAADESAAVFRYNNSPVYVADVLAWSAAYRLAGDSVSDEPVDVAAPPPPPEPLPPTEPLPPPGLVQAPAPDTRPAPTVAPTTDTPAPPPPFVLPTLPPLPCLIFCPPA